MAHKKSTHQSLSDTWWFYELDNNKTIFLFTVMEYSQDVNNSNSTRPSEYFEDEVEETKLLSSRTDTVSIIAQIQPSTSLNPPAQISEELTFYTCMISKETGEEYFVNQGLTPNQNIHWLKDLYLTESITFYELPIDNIHCLSSLF